MIYEHKKDCEEKASGNVKVLPYRLRFLEVVVSKKIDQL